MERYNEHEMDQELFNYIAENFSHTPTQGEMNDLRQIIHKEAAPDLLPFLVAKWKAQLEGYYSVHATAEQRTVRLAVLEEYGWLISMHVRDKLKQFEMMENNEQTPAPAESPLPNYQELTDDIRKAIKAKQNYDTIKELCRAAFVDGNTLYKTTPIDEWWPLFCLHNNIASKTNHHPNPLT